MSRDKPDDGYLDAVILHNGVPLDQLLFPAPAKGGPKPLAIWSELIEPHFDNEVKLDGPFPSLGSARDAVILLLQERGKAVPHTRTIERRIRAHRPNWVRARGA